MHVMHTIYMKAEYPYALNKNKKDSAITATQSTDYSLNRELDMGLVFLQLLLPPHLTKLQVSQLIPVGH